MSKRQFVTLVFRMFAVFIFINLLVQFPVTIRLVGGFGFSGLPETARGLSFLAGFIAVLFIARTLWYRSEWVMHKVFETDVLFDRKGEPIHDTLNDEQESDIENAQAYFDAGLNLESITTLAFTLLGVWIVASNLPEAVGSIARLIWNPLTEIGDAAPDRSIKVEAIIVASMNILKVILGYALLVKPLGLTHLLARMRQMPVDADAEDTAIVAAATHTVHNDRNE